MSVIITSNSPSPVKSSGLNPINNVSNSFYLPPFTYYLYTYSDLINIQATISGTVYAVLVAPNGLAGTTSGGGGGGGGGGQIFCGVLPTGNIQITQNGIFTVTTYGASIAYANVYSGKNGGDGGGSNAGNGGSGGSTTSSTASANYKINGGGGGGGGKGNNGGDNGNDGAAGYGYGGGSNGTKGSSGGDGGAGGYGTIDFYDNTPSFQWQAGAGGGKNEPGTSGQTPFCLLYWIPNTATAQNPFYIYTLINNEPLTTFPTFPTLLSSTATNPINGENPPDANTMYYLIPPAAPFSTTYIYRTSADYPSSSNSTCYLSVLGCPGSGGIYGTETNSTSVSSSKAGGCGGGGTGTFGTIKFDVTQIPLINVSCPGPSPLSVTLIYNSSYAMEYLTVGGSFCSNITNIQNPPYVINFSTGLQGGNGDATENSNSPNGGNGASGGVQYLNFDSGNLTDMNGGMGGAGGISTYTSGIVGASFNEQTGAYIGSNGDNVSSMECVFPDTTTCTVVSGVGGFQGQVGGSGEAPFALLTFYT